jgi:hypothetical protein
MQNAENHHPDDHRRQSDANRQANEIMDVDVPAQAEAARSEKRFVVEEFLLGQINR